MDYFSIKCSCINIIMYKIINALLKNVQETYNTAYSIIKCNAIIVQRFVSNKYCMT